MSYSDMWKLFNNELDKLNLDKFSYLESKVIFDTMLMSGKSIDMVESNIQDVIDEYSKSIYVKSKVLDKNGISPNSIWHLYHIYLIKNNPILKLNKPLKIIEIGGGFGNFCRIFNMFFDVRNYHIVDSHNMWRLANHFLTNHGLNINYTKSENISDLNDKSFDLFISNMCLSETPDYFRNEIYTKILPNCEQVFILDANPNTKGELSHNIRKFTSNQVNFVKSRISSVHSFIGAN